MKKVKRVYPYIVTFKDSRKKSAQINAVSIIDAKRTAALTFKGVASVKSKQYGNK